jgi:uncharacterized protein YwgA
MTDAGPRAVADLIYRAGGHLVGRTRLQKSACLLELAGVGYGFRFNYRLYGPYSDELQVACDDAEALGLIKERKRAAAWGGHYYSFSSEEPYISAISSKTRARKQLLKIAVEADSVELELAVTAGFLAGTGISTPWERVMTQKPAKATPERMARAKVLYQRLSRIATPSALPKIV